VSEKQTVTIPDITARFFQIEVSADRDFRPRFAPSC